MSNVNVIHRAVPGGYKVYYNHFAPLLGGVQSENISLACECVNGLTCLAFVRHHGRACKAKLVEINIKLLC